MGKKSLRMIFAGVLGCMVAVPVAAEPPFLQWQHSNCWLISTLHVLYNMPTLVEALVGSGGDEYGLAPEVVVMVEKCDGNGVAAPFRAFGEWWW